MGSDIARVSFDPTRQYRSVVLQQGRVTLDGDGNEASRIASEALRLETIDIIGPAGTPDDGYKVGLDASGNVAVLPGTMYLGGWRLVLDKPVELDQQPDWLDMTPNQAVSGRAVVALLATEQSICAVEDQPLREAALGGPDSAARRRLMQHFLRLPVDGATCDIAAQQVDTLLAEDGVTLDPKTFQLLSSARLQVGFVPPAGPPDPCDPPAQGGYLGADNQMIRVTVIDFNPQNGTGTLLWGWNNASFLYRGAPSGQAMTLTPIPVDAEHSPQQNQAIEVLLTQADLGDGNDIAAIQGQVAVLTQAYDPDTDLMTLPATFTLPSTNRPLFVRLWQATVPFTSGTPVALDAVSGLSVTITITALPTYIAARPVWHFAVRPATPTLVYPPRYLEAPQPPDGPRQWLCDLAVIELDRFQLLDDCRKHFGPITGQGCCCGVTMGPAEVLAAGGLQAALDRVAGSGTPATLTLRPGVYVLAAPLTLTQKHEHLTLEGCDGVILQADPEQVQAFSGGTILIQQAGGIRLSRLVLELPIVPVTVGNVQFNVMNGLNATASPRLTIDDCTFAFAPGDKTQVVGAAVVVEPDCADLTVRGNRFVCGGNTAETLLTIGVLSATTDNTAPPLDDCEISGNLFAGLGLAVGTLGASGLVRCCDNRVRQCAGGFYFLSMPNALAGQFAGRVSPDAAMEAAHLPASPAMLASIAETVRKAVAETGARASAAGELDTGEEGARTIAPAAVAGESIDSILDTLDQQIESAELGGVALRSVLHLRNNDIELSAASRPSSGPTPFAGLDLDMVNATQACAALVHGNRIETPATDVAAAMITMYQAQAVITANLFTQLPGDTPAPVPCLRSWISGSFEVMANVISPASMIAPSTIVPARASSLPTNDWPFLNTIG